jgi:hypothetical protein
MLPTGTTFTSTATTVSQITTAVFNTVQTYNFTESNYLGLLVYLNDVLLVRNYGYIVSPDSPVLTITVPLTVGDVDETSSIKNGGTTVVSSQPGYSAQGYFGSFLNNPAPNPVPTYSIAGYGEQTTPTIPAINGSTHATGLGAGGTKGSSGTDGTAGIGWGGGGGSKANGALAGGGGGGGFDLNNVFSDATDLTGTTPFNNPTATSAPTAEPGIIVITITQ